MMKIERIACFVVALATMVTATAYAATPDQAETWNAGSTEGWSGYDVLNCSARPVSNPGTHLQIAFGKQSMSFPAVYLMRADAAASGGVFVGDYGAAGVTSISFRFYCPTHVPANARLYIYSVTTGNRWYFSLPGLQAGQWTDFTIPLSYAAGWKLDADPTQEKFETDVTQGIGWVGIRIQRNSSTVAQNYGMDDFVLNGYNPDDDTDGDGFSDQAEWLLGTNPNDPASLFASDIGVGAPDGSIVVRWPSKAGNSYEVWRSTNLLEGFSVYSSSITGTPPVNVFVDTNVVGNAFFYRIKLE